VTEKKEKKSRVIASEGQGKEQRKKGGPYAQPGKRGDSLGNLRPSKGEFRNGRGSNEKNEPGTDHNVERLEKQDETSKGAKGPKH